MNATRSILLPLLFIRSVILGAIWFGGLVLIDAAPIVRNLVASQRGNGSRLVDITYDLTLPNNASVSVILEASNDGGATWTVPVTSVTGAVGMGVTSGAGKAIVWDAGADWPRRYTDQMYFRITADDGLALIPAGSLIPEGSFTMGRTSGDLDADAPPTTVTVRAFRLQKTETTKALWDEVRTWALNNGYTDLGLGQGKAPTHPVHSVTWWDVIKWCNARSEKEGLTPVYTVGGAVMRTGTAVPDPNWDASGYRLPTEAEWEKAARGGSVGQRFPWGEDTINHARANYRVYSANGTANDYTFDVVPRPPATGNDYYHPSYTTGGTPYTSPVGSFGANGYGLYDMAGNLSEWCWDWYGSNYYGTNTTNPRGPATGTTRVFRGGSWTGTANHGRSGIRASYAPGLSFNFFGFRPALSSLASGNPGLPTVTTPTAISITGAGATLGGKVTSDGGATITERGIVYSVSATNANPLIGGTGVTKVPGVGTTGVFTVDVTRLTAGIVYAFKAYATNNGGISYSYSSLGIFTTSVEGAAGFSLIPGGSFTMGRTSGDTDTDAPPVNVTVSPFYLQQTETSKAQWDAVRTWAVNNGYTDLAVGDGKASDHPVQSVTWWDVIKWCNARSEKEGLTPVYTVLGAVMRTGTAEPTANWSANGYRLPTEAEWEKAARAGVSGKRFPWGTDSISHAQANYYGDSTYAYDQSPINDYHPSYKAGGQPYTSPVGSFGANAYGLYDMAGNVWEWSWDWYGPSYETTSDGTTDPRGPASGLNRVLRGGSSASGAFNARCSSRSSFSPVNSFYNYGFRPARTHVIKDMSLIPGGSFAMGRTSGDTDVAAPPITVTVSPFYIQLTETTKAQWDEVRTWAVSNGYTDLGAGDGKASDHPVQTVTWYDVLKWCNARSEKEGLIPVYSVGGGVMRTGTVAPNANWTANGYRLPTEAEWEKAARGGVSGKRFPWGTDSISHAQANYFGNSSYAYDLSPINDYHPIYKAGGQPYTSPVGSFGANAYGLYDMAGNVLEWSWDWYEPSYETTSDGTTDPRGPASGTLRVLRGGSWSDNASNARCANRDSIAPVSASRLRGFRPVRTSLTSGEAVSPSVTTPTAINLTAGGATLGGKVTADGGSTITERGIVYSVAATNPNPEIGGTGVTKVPVAGSTGVLTAAVTGLTQGTNYRYKAYATNSRGTTYTSVANFTTLSTNADLSSLSLNAGTLSPTFASGTINYTASVSNAATSITVTPTRAQSGATIEARVNTGTYAAVTSGSPSSLLTLNVGTNTVAVRVTAEDGITQKTYTVTVTRMAAQLITFANPGAQLANATVNVSATGGGSGNPVTFTVEGPATLSVGNVLSFTGAGSVTVRANQAANGLFDPAPEVAQTFTVSKATATVTLGSLSQTYDGTPKSATALTDPAGKTVVFTYEGSATAPTNAGSYAVVGAIDDAIYQGSTDGTIQIAKAAQTITFAAIPDKQTTDTLTLFATGGGSGNSVTFAVTEGPATISSGVLSFSGAGSVTITASQAGDANYESASSVSRTFTVIKDMSLIPGGSFAMGVTSGDADTDAPSITVTVNPFYIQQTETTKAQWDEVRAWGLSNGYTDLAVGVGKASNHPVQSVTWWDVVKWCNARSEKEGLTPVYTVSGAVMRTGTTEPLPNWSANGYRLPAEAEWEKAARGGVSGNRFPWGTDTISHAAANFRNNGGEVYATGTTDYHPSYTTGGEPYTSPVGSFVANGYGLYDMAGNVWEWNWDWYGSSYYTMSDGTTDPRGPASGTFRVSRGGSWLNNALSARSANRSGSTPGFTYNSNGFRPVRSSIP